MDHRPKWKIKNYNDNRRKHRWPGYGSNFLGKNQRHERQNKYLISWASLKLNTTALRKTMSRQLKTWLKLEENICKRRHLIRTVIQNIQRTLKFRKKTTQLKNVTKTLTDTSPNIYSKLGNEKMLHIICYQGNVN